MKKLSKSIVLMLVALALCVTATACNDDPTTTIPEPTKYTVTYELGGGTGTLPTETDKAEGDKFALASADGLTKEGKLFDRWSDGTDKYAAGAEYTMPAHRVTFTAQWVDAGQPAPTKYTVTYDLDGGVGALPVETDKAEGEKFALASADGLTKEGKEFDGWSDGTSNYAAGAEYTMPANNVTLTAQWATPVPYTLTYVLGDDVTTGSENIDIADVAPQGGEYLPGAKVTLAMATYFGVENKIFGGWSDGENTYPMGYEYTMPAKAVTITALWIDPLTASDVTGTWTNADGNSLELTSNSEFDVDCVGIMDGKSVGCYLEEGMLLTADYSEWWFITGSSERLLLTLFNDPDDGEDFGTAVATLIFTQKSGITNAAMSEFAGKWKRTDTNMPILITNDGAYYGLSLNDGVSYTVGSTIVINAGEAGYYLLKKDGDELKGTYTAAEREPVEVTFAQSDFVTLTVEGEYNQAVINGATPDEDKIEAAKPQAPAGQEFDKWVIAGTDTEFDPAAVINADTAIEATFKDVEQGGNIELTGNVTVTGIGGSYTITKIVINSANPKEMEFYDADGNKYQYSFQQDDDDSTWRPDNSGYEKGNAYYYYVKINNNAHYILIKKDLSAVWLCDGDDNAYSNGEFLAE